MDIVKEFEEELKVFIPSPNVIACCNGTAALHTALTACDIGKGDKVITTPFTFIATSNAILYNGGIPLFADIRPDDYLIDVNEIEKLLRKHRDTKAILVVHLFGKVCDMENICNLASEYHVKVIEDCAQAFGAEGVSNFGDIGTFSFYASKNLSTFEGGAIATNSDYLTKMCRAIVNHGATGKNHYEILGYNYRMSQLTALIGLTQLKLHKKGIRAELGSYGIQNGYYPEVIYNQPLYKKLGIKGKCPVAEEIARQVREWSNA